MHNSQLFTFPTQSYLVFYSFCASLLYSLTMGFIISSFSPYNLQLMFFMCLLIFALTYLILIEVFCTAISRDSSSPEDLPEAMNDREKWRERVRDLRASSTTWWWWWQLFSSFYIFHTCTSKCSFQWSLNNNKSPQVSRTPLCILADCFNVVVYMVLILALISNFTSLFSKSLATVPSAPSIIGITVIFMFHSFLSSLARYNGTAKSSWW